MEERNACGLKTACRRWNVSYWKNWKNLISVISASFGSFCGFFYVPVQLFVAGYRGRGDDYKVHRCYGDLPVVTAGHSGER